MAWQISINYFKSNQIKSYQIKLNQNQKNCEDLNLADYISFFFKWKGMNQFEITVVIIHQVKRNQVFATNAKLFIFTNLDHLIDLTETRFVSVNLFS